jgi:hypothetical protein
LISLVILPLGFTWRGAFGKAYRIILFETQEKELAKYKTEGEAKEEPPKEEPKAEEKKEVTQQNFIKALRLSHHSGPYPASSC